MNANRKEAEARRADLQKYGINRPQQQDGIAGAQKILRNGQPRCDCTKGSAGPALDRLLRLTRVPGSDSQHFRLFGGGDQGGQGSGFRDSLQDGTDNQMGHFLSIANLFRSLPANVAIRGAIAHEQDPWMNIPRSNHLLTSAQDIYTFQMAMATGKTSADPYVRELLGFIPIGTGDGHSMEDLLLSFDAAQFAAIANRGGSACELDRFLYGLR
jgi:hypothetical protein